MDDWGHLWIISCIVSIWDLSRDDEGEVGRDGWSKTLDHGGTI